MPLLESVPSLVDLDDTCWAELDRLRLLRNRIAHDVLAYDHEEWGEGDDYDYATLPAVELDGVLVRIDDLAPRTEAVYAISDLIAVRSGREWILGADTAHPW